MIYYVSAMDSGNTIPSFGTARDRIQYGVLVKGVHYGSKIQYPELAIIDRIELSKVYPTRGIWTTLTT